MAILKSTIVLDNQMSAALDQIKKDALAVMESMGKLPEISNEIADYMGLMTEKSAEFKQAFGMTLEEMHEKNEKMLEVFGETKESIAEMTEKVHEKAEAIEEVAESIGNVGKNSNEAMRGMNQMANGAARLLSQMGLIPRSFAMGVSGVNQLDRGIRRSTTSMAKFTAALGPITLLATTGMAVANIFSLIGRNVEDEALPSIDEMLRRSERLGDESERLTRSVKENIEQMRLLAGVGASDDLLGWFERRNEYYELQIKVLQTMAGQARREAAEAAHEAAMELLGGHLGLGGLLYIGEGLEYARAQYAQLLREGDSILVTIQRDFIRVNEELQKDWENTLKKNIEYISSWGSALQGFPGFEEMEKQITSLLSMYADLNAGYRILGDAERERERERERLETKSVRRKEVGLALIERLAAAEAHRASVVQDVHRHILRSYRDTYAAAESMRNAHNALTHAINGTSSAYNSHLHYFNQIMSLSPQYFNMLFNERGALLDVEDAVHAVTQAQIGLLGSQQALAMLDSARTWQETQGTLSGYRAEVLNTTQGVWGLVEAEMALIKHTEMLNLLGQGYAPGEIQARAHYAVRPLMEQINAIRQMTESGQASALRYGTTRTNPLYVADVTAHNIMGEFVRLREDVARREYMTGAFQRGNVIINMGGYNYTPNVYPAELSAGYRADIVREGAKKGALAVSEMMEEAITGSLE